MRTYEPNPRWPAGHLRAMRSAIPVLAICLGPLSHIAAAQTPASANLPQQMQQLEDAITRTQAQLEQSQRDLNDLRRQLSALQSQITQAQGKPAPSLPAEAAAESSSSQDTAASMNAAIQDIRERQSIEETQIATHELSKVATESKYPLRVTGLLLMNGFVNTRAVDIASTPTLAIPGPGSTGATVRQSILGLDADGPHWFGARSYADLRADFDGSPASGNSTTSYSGYYDANTTLLRLRTAHAGLQWEHTQAQFALDRAILAPDTPTSLTAVAEPALAWSGNLWAWNPQAQLTQQIDFPRSRALQLQAALIDVEDAPLSPVIPAAGTSATMSPATGEMSRWPGAEARIALLGRNQPDERDHFGVGGYFAPHHTSFGGKFDSWASTADLQLSLPARLKLTASGYRGAALGGLGGGGYKDFAYTFESDTGV
ncbi:MAG TPA: hypothetical protein VJS11_11680, partial [Acidobacteriaceae bacterium]|nr:hypothetical protein [Acidobacteriaceae bacterium]